MFYRLTMTFKSGEVVIRDFQLSDSHLMTFFDGMKNATGLKSMEVTECTVVLVYFA